jgi:hypothetical protein
MRLIARSMLEKHRMPEKKVKVVQRCPLQLQLMYVHPNPLSPTNDMKLYSNAHDSSTPS